jgi:hypothetical protein
MLDLIDPETGCIRDLTSKGNTRQQNIYVFSRYGSTLHFQFPQCPSVAELNSSGRPRSSSARMDCLHPNN